MFQLQPVDIADAFTLEEIEAEITALKESITSARASLQDRFDDTQAQMMVRRQKLADLNNDLAIYIKAKNILAGTDSSTAQFNSADYNPTTPRV